MNQVMFWLLALFISLSSPAMERNADFRQSSLAAKGTAGPKLLPAYTGYQPWSGEIRSGTAASDTTMCRVWGGGSQQGRAWVKTNEVRYVYDRMLALQERDATNGVQVTYTRGLDLSGGFQGAGGIGGLLARTDAQGSTFYHADGAGNVTALMDAQEGIAARYLYNPFGRLTGQWGPMAQANRYRFSSKEVHAQSGLSYYGFRFYDAGLQRWLNPDPLGEGAGPNLYEAFSNNPLLFADRDGLDNMYNMPAGNNAVPDIVASMPAGGGGVISGYREGIDPLFLLASQTPFDPNQLLSLPGPLNDLVTLASDSSTGNEKLQAGAGLAVWALTKGKKLGKSAKPCPAAKTGGRLGSDLTRGHVANVAAEMESRGWRITGGGGKLPEEYLRGPNGRLGSSYPDITATKNDRTLRVNTVDTYADGITPAAREAANAARIRAQTPGDHLLLVPKP